VNVIIGKRKEELMPERKVRAIIFSLVSLAVWLIYFRTTSPTVVFWDVGEFLATSYILGIPHPPGTPFYVILGKFFSMLPLPMSFLGKIFLGGHAVEPVLRITMISMVSGALTAGFVYLIIVRVINIWNPGFPKHYAHLAGILGALIGATARTVWMNSIEAETYTPSTFVIVFLTWVALNWWEKRDDPKSVRYLVFSLYVLFLSSGIHLMPLIFFPVLFVFVWIVKPEIIWDKDFLAVAIMSLLIILLIKISYNPSLRAGILLLLSIGVLIYYLKLKNLLDFNNTWVIIFLLGGAISLIGVLSRYYNYTIIGTFIAMFSLYFRAQLYKEWKGFAFLLIILGLTVEFYLLVRAHHSPRINEADPSTWRAFLDVLLRKQYEPTKIFPRKIPFLHQLQLYGLYFSWQYPLTGLIYLLILLGIVGFVTSYLNDRKSFALIGGAFIVASIGLIIYLNLKDSPTHTLHPGNPTEVRDRDYFFATSYTFFGLFVGLGFWEVMRIIRKYSRVKIVAPLAAYSLAPIFTGWQISYFYPRVDRSKNYIAEDYAYNMLISPSKGGIMYTNGDNDTFPLWFAQEVLGVRRDVIIANLSLLNTNWYIKQLKSWGAPISFSYEEIDRLPPQIWLKDKVIFLADVMIRDMISVSSGYEPKEFVSLPTGVRIPKIYFASKEEFKEKVIKGANFKVPIYFAITVARDHFKGWEDHLRMEGLAFKLEPEPVSEDNIEGMDLERTEFLLHDNLPPDEFLEKYAESIPPQECFRYRGVFNRRVFKDETHEKLIRNYASVAVRLGIHFDLIGNKKKAVDELELSLRFLEELRLDTSGIKNQKLAILMRMAELEKQMGDYEKAISFYERGLQIQNLGIFYKNIGQCYAALGDTLKAIDYLKLAKSTEPRDRENFTILSDYYLSIGDTQAAINVLKEWLKARPGDGEVKKRLSEIEG
jgi:hypothetical protein